MQRYCLRALAVLVPRGSTKTTSSACGGDRGAPPVRVFHIFVLLNLAFSARLYELLGRQPAFFGIRQSRVLDILVWVLAIGILLPGLVALLPRIAGGWSRRVGQALSAVLVLLSITAIALPPLKHLAALPSPVVMALALAAGLLGAAACFWLAAARKLVTLLSPAVVVFPAIFLTISPTARLLHPAAGSSLPGVKVASQVPVVLMILDEFSGISIMGADRQIDRDRCPNLAALAREAIWFRNATTMSTSTHHAIPSLLTGGHPRDPSTAPVFGEYPQNLFTLLGRSHELAVEETETHLCPPEWSGGRADEETFMRRLASLMIDTAVLELHILLPADWPLRLPDVTGRWGNFLSRDGGSGGRPAHGGSRRDQFDAMLSRIRPTDKPGLYYAHVMLPHVPWSYLPSGKEYPFPFESLAAGNADITHGLVGLHRGSEHWTDDETAVVQAYHRYLLQVGFVDRLIGRLVSRLKEVGLYDRSLIVLTSDHGVSCRAGHDRRCPDELTAPDILTIPLIMKLPHQREGLVSDRNVQTADVLPTIADVLKVEVPWTVYGASALDPTRPEAPEKEVSLEDPWDERLTFDGKFEAKYEALAAMLAMGQSPAGQGGSGPIGPHADLVGRRLGDLDVGGPSPWRVELALPEEFDRVDPDGPRIPCYIGGRIVPGPEADGAAKRKVGPFVVSPEGDSPIFASRKLGQSPARKLGQAPAQHLAVSVNGTIRAVTRTFRIEGLDGCWAAMVPEQSFRPGRNEVRVLVVSASAGKTRLHPVP